jgi:hypothetical protein
MKKDVVMNTIAIGGDHDRQQHRVVLRPVQGQV